MALKDISLNIGVEGVDQVTQGMKRIEGSLDSMGRKTQTATQQMEAAFARANSALMTLGVGFTAAGIIREIYRAIEAIDSLRTSTIQIAAIITTLQGPKNVAAHYAQASKYAEVLAIKLQEVNAKSFANYDTLMKMVNVMAQQGVVMDVNNKKQVDAFTSLSNAVAMYTTGQNQSIQANQEIRALMSGQTTLGSQLALQIDSMAKSSGLYKGGLKEIVDLGKKHGDTLERFAPFLVGINAASGDIEKTWGAITSSAETAKAMIQRAGFDSFYKEAVQQAGELVAYLKEHAEIIGNRIQQGWLAVRGTLESIGYLLTAFKEPLGIIGEFTGAVVRGWALLASSVFPPLFERISSFIASLWEVVKLVGNIVNMGAKAAVGDWAGAAAAWNAAKTNYKQGGVQMGKAFKAGFLDEVATRSAEFLALDSLKTNSVSKVSVPKLPATKTDDPHADTVRKASAAAKAAAALKESWLDTARALQAKIDMAGMDAVGDKFRKAQLEADNLRDKYKALPPALRDTAYALIDANFAAADAATWNEVLAKRAEEYTRKTEDEAAALRKVTDAYQGLQEKMYPVLEAERRRVEAVQILTAAHEQGLNPALAESIAKYDEYIKRQNEVRTIMPLEDLTKSTFAGNSFGNSQANDYGKATTALEEMNKMYALQSAAVAALDQRKREANAVEAKSVWSIYQKKRELGKLDAIQSLQTMQHVQDQMAAWRTMFATTGQLFKEGSRGRQIMHDLEMAATLAEIGMQVQKNIMIATGAIANQGNGDPYTAFGRIAAMISVMAGVLSMAGIAFGGGGGGGGGGATALPQPPGFGSGSGRLIGSPLQGNNMTEESLQLLANSATNASLAIRKVADGLTKIGDLFTSEQGKMFVGNLPTSPDMKSGNAGGSWQGAAVGAYYGGVVGAVVGGIIGGIGNAMFGWSNKWQTVGGGFELGLAGGDITNRSYLDRKKKGGWFSGDKYATDYSAGNPALTEMFGSYLDQIKASISRASVSTGTTSNMETVKLAGTKIATANRKPEDIQKDLDAWFAKAADMLAQSVVGLKDFAFYGENAFAAIVRLSTSLQGVNEQLELTGHTLVESTLAGADAAWRLADAFGGLDKMQDSTGKYFSSMFTDEEQKAMKAAQASRQVKVAFEEMNHAAPLTRDGFRSIVNGLDLTTETGMSTYVAMMKVSEAFGTVITRAEELRDRLRKFDDDLTGRSFALLDNNPIGEVFNRVIKYEGELAEARQSGMATGKLSRIQGKELSAYLKDGLNKANTAYFAAQEQYNKLLGDNIQKVIKGFADTAASMRKIAEQLAATRNSLLVGELSPLSATDKLAESRNQMDALYRRGRLGDQNALSSLSGAATSYLQLAQSYYASSPQYAAEFGYVQNILSSSEQTALSQADYAQRQIDMQQRQLDMLTKSDDKRTAEAEAAQAELVAQNAVLREGFLRLIALAEQSGGNMETLATNLRQQAAA